MVKGRLSSKRWEKECDFDQARWSFQIKKWWSNANIIIPNLIKSRLHQELSCFLYLALPQDIPKKKKNLILLQQEERATHGNKKRLINITELGRNHAENLCNAFLGLDTFCACDRVSPFKGMWEGQTSEAAMEI